MLSARMIAIRPQFLVVVGRGIGGRTARKQPGNSQETARAGHVSTAESTRRWRDWQAIDREEELVILLRLRRVSNDAGRNGGMGGGARQESCSRVGVIYQW